mmetsp:Transcript_33777/g.88887  ORF Transcript_33777/g.88887 Transcript_33777/m.88887 type:complete len:309 (+) Transcript_33777:112-1038(+)
MGSELLKSGKSKWSGIERAFRDQCVRDGILKPEDVEELEKEDVKWLRGNRAIALEVEDTFKRIFTEQKLGLRLNVGDKGRIIVKSCVADTPAATRRIPPGVFLDTINDEATAHKSLQQVQQLMIDAKRPITLGFSQSTSSKAIAESSRREAAGQCAEARAAKVAEEKAEAARKAADEAAAAAAREILEALPTFSVTFTEQCVGLALRDGGGDLGGKSLGAKGHAFVKKSQPLSPAWRAGIPPDVRIVSVNGKSTQFRRFKEVKKMIELAPRPVTIDFSAEDDPTYPDLTSASRPKVIGGVPSYAMRPT